MVEVIEAPESVLEREREDPEVEQEEEPGEETHEGEWVSEESPTDEGKTLLPIPHEIETAIHEIAARVLAPGAPPASLDTFHELMELAELAEASGCFPGQTRVQLLTKAMLGKALDIPAAVAFSQIHTIGKSLSPSAELQRTLVMRAGYRIRSLQSTHQICELELVVAATGEVVGSASFTFEEAKQAQLLKSDAWIKWMPDMLYARASTRLIGRFAPWVLHFDATRCNP